MKPLAATLVPRIRELMRHRLTSSLGSGITAMLDNMLELARQSQTTEDHRLILDTLNHVDQHKRKVAAAFEQQLLALYDEKLGWLQERVREHDSAPRAFAEFDLLDDQVFAQQVALKKLVQKTLEEIDKVDLVCVEVRLRELFETPVEGARNPVGPGTALKAAQQASAIETEDEALQVSLINALQPYLAAGLTQFYRELNAMLLEAGLRPDYRPEIQRDTSRRSASGGWQDAGGRPNTGGWRDTGGRPDAGLTISQVMNLRELLPNRASSPLDLEEIFAALLSGPAANRQYGARMLADAQGDLYAGVVSLPAPVALLQTLTAMQQTVGAYAPADGAQALQAAVAQMESAGEHPLDRLTGELVEVVFDFLLRDRGLPDTVRSELARLQIVALKAALLDRSFFARREHPMRVLLDEIVRIGSDPTLDTRADGYFVAGLREVVDRLVADFEQDLALFDAATERLRAVAAEAAAEAETALAEMTAALMAEEREAHVRASAAEAVAARLKDDAPAFLRAFLEKTWVAALADARISHPGEQLWDERLRLVDALQESVKPRLRHELPGYVASLPALVRAVRDGIRAAGMPEEEARAFMDELMTAHTAVLQMRATVEVRQAPKPAGPAAEALTEPIRFEASRPAVLLQRGDLVEFCDQGPPQRAKLMWVSPARSRFLFSAGLGHLRTMPAEEVAEALATGMIRPVAQDSLLNRALASLGEGAEAQ